MTGTAKTEEKEFVEIYGLEVVPIPTNVDVARNDENDLIFKTVEAKFKAVVDDIKERHESRPAGPRRHDRRRDLGASERAAQAPGRQHNVLNAKEHAREAEIIKDAGQVGAVTIATNMAGRGVDIKIDDTVRELGGLYVLGTERHEARRIDNQLRGRSGRQGDPGETRFYLSGQDDLVRLFAGDRLYNIMEQLQASRRPAHGSEDPDEPDRERPEEGRGAELRPAQERPQVRRRDERAAPRHLRAAPRGAGGTRTSRREIKEEWLPEVISNIVDDYTAMEMQGDWDLGELVNAMETLYGTGVTADELKGARP